MSGKLTTHVLDTANGCPGTGIAIALWQLDLKIDSKTLLKTTKTNHDGRTNEPLLTGEELEIGIYELIFLVGNYFARYGNYPDPAFLDEIPLRFGISDLQVHYHVPLLVSPWSYSTYRGS
ncbi:hydroxyisourate hydrolase [Pleurocapsa sp. CCALA 161]|uniref:hydroxyisourate hydrolase n=1 Tax=Pleurocapsa sp. CCALA 161 TaxID=2107688 RepID=UPI000D074F67|nr:hydroxyisourate hydrolase [Pleurocapsa sp. CCALA 161]PSB12411.1 hydroxyisourate hydrolase [Pleurocapsa sp. CCALA 161]